MMKQKMLLFFITLLPTFVFADPMCRTEDYNSIGCHFVWGFMSLISLTPIIILVLIMRIIINKLMLIRRKTYLSIMTYAPIIFAYIFCHIENIIIADLTIYNNQWPYYRDAFIIPISATLFFYIILYRYFRRKEKSNRKV